MTYLNRISCPDLGFCLKKNDVGGKKPDISLQGSH